MYNLCRILQHVVNGFDNVSLAQHYSVIERHQLVFSCLRATLLPAVFHPQKGSQTASAKYSLCHQTACHTDTFSKNLEYIRILIADIGTSKYKCYFLASVIARKVEFEAMAPAHCSLSVSGNSLEHLVGVSPEIVAYGYHRRIDECYADTSSESSQIKENMSWKNTRLSYSTKRLYDTAFGKYDFIIPLIKNR